MLKKIILGAAVSLAAMTAAVAAPATGEGCTGCGTGTASALPILAESAAAIPHPGPVPVIRTCCDPVLGQIDMKTQFSIDLAPGGNFGSNYGIKFNPSAPFDTAFDNTAFIAAVLGGVPTSGANFLVMHGDMKTNGVSGNTPWPSSISLGWIGPSLIYAAPGGFLAINATAPSTPTFALSPHNYPTMNPNGHMKPNGTIYVTKLTYWLYSFNGRIWVKRPVYCTNVPDRFVGIRINTAAMRMAPGQPPQLDTISQDVASGGDAGARVAVGAPVQLSATEVAALPEQMKAAQR